MQRVGWSIAISWLIVAVGCGDGAGGGAAASGGRTLVSVVAEPPGVHCASGGFAVDSGVDDDGDGVLSPGEIDDTQYQCNPAASDPPAPHVLVRTRTEQPGLHCALGGTAVLSGLDGDRDGALEDAEVTDTTYVCDTPDAPPRVLTRVGTIAPGDACAYGGTAVDSGLDLDGNGALDDGEVETHTVLCSAETASDEVEVVAGTNHSCARKADGRVWCWGSNLDHQLGIPGYNDQPGAVPVPGIAGATSLAAGDYHACAVVTGGAVWCWGDNLSHELGSDGYGWTARQVPGIPAVRQVVAGGSHSCGLAVDATVWCWGSDAFAESGQGGQLSWVAPSPVAGVADVVALSAGEGHTCALLGDGAVQCWGLQLGPATDDETCDFGLPCHRAPTPVAGLPAAVAVSSGTGRACAITADHDAWCWGANDYGELGDDTTTSRSRPAPVVGLHDLREVSTGGNHTCAARGDNSLWCWGSNAFGQLALGMVGYAQHAPRQVPGQFGLAGLATGAYHSCALRDGHVQCWGHNDQGQVGPIGQPTPTEILVDVRDASAGNHAACAVRLDASVWCWGAFAYSEFYGIWDVTPQRVSGLPAAASVAVGATHACIAGIDGSVWCWGGNGRGELGNTRANPELTPVKVAGIYDAVAVYAGGYQSCALRRDGSLWCWGTDGTDFGGGVPPTQLLATATSVALGDLHGCAVDGSHQAWCWGNNEWAQVSQRALDVAPMTLVATDVDQVSAGYDQSCALGLDGGVTCWGDDKGPASVALGELTALEGGYWHTCVLRPDQTAACTGYNSHGQLGDGTYDYHTAPVAVAGLDELVQLSAGYEQTCARRADHSLWCWGANDAGQLGTGGLTERVTTPVRVSL